MENEAPPPVLCNQMDLYIPSDEPFLSPDGETADNTLFNQALSSTGENTLKENNEDMKNKSSHFSRLRNGLQRQKSSRENFRAPLNGVHKELMHVVRRLGGGGRHFEEEEIQPPTSAASKVQAHCVGGEASIREQQKQTEPTPLEQLLSATEAMAVAPCEHLRFQPRPDDCTTEEEDVLLVTRALDRHNFLGKAQGAGVALRSLRRLSIDEGARGTLAKVGAIRAAIETMVRFATETRIQELGLLFLGDVSRSAIANKIEVVQRGGIDIIHRILRDSKDPALMARACVTLRTTVSQCEYNAIRVGVRGGPSVVLRAIRRHPRNERLQVDGWDALTVFADSAVENVAQLRDAGAGAEAVATLRIYADRPDVLAAALRTIAALLQANTPAPSGLTLVIADAVSRFGTTRRDIGEACSRCAGGLLYERRRDVDRPESAFPATLAADLVRVAARWQRCCRTTRIALAGVADAQVGDDAAKQAVGGVAAALLDAVRKRVDENDIIGSALGLRAVRNATAKGGATRTMARAGAAMAVTHAMKTFPDEEDVQEQGGAALVNLLAIHGGGGVRAAHGLSTHLAYARGRFRGSVAGMQVETVAQTLGVGADDVTCGLGISRRVAP